MTEKETVKEIDDLFALEDQGGNEEEVTETDEPAIDPAEVEELRTYKAESETAKREALIAEAFKEAGVSPKAARLYSALHPDGEPSTADIAAFSEEYGLQREKPTGYTPTLIQGGHTPVAKKYTRQEMEEIARDNPARARALAEAGRVQWSNAAINAQPQR